MTIDCEYFINEMLSSFYKMFTYKFWQYAHRFDSEVGVIGSYLIGITHVIMALARYEHRPNTPHTWRKHILIPGDKLHRGQKSVSDKISVRWKHSWCSNEIHCEL